MLHWKIGGENLVIFQHGDEYMKTLVGSTENIMILLLKRRI